MDMTRGQAPLSSVSSTRAGASPVCYLESPQELEEGLTCSKRPMFVE